MDGDDFDVLVPSPTVPGFYRVNQMAFLLDREGSWWTEAIDFGPSWEFCVWPYIEQMLAVHEIELVMELAPADLTDLFAVETWLQAV